MKYSYKVSVVIPVYNAEKYLDECLNSLFSQTMDCSNYEILLINDGSTDNSRYICEYWKEKYNNISYYEKKNSGVSDTRNLGIKEAKGKYILFLDPDDFLSKNTLIDISNFFDEHYDEIDLVTYSLIMYYNKNNKRLHFRYRKEYTNGTAVYPLDQYYRAIQTGINIVIKNTKNYFFDIDKKYGEDEYFNTTILMKKKKIGYVQEAKYYYRQHGGSITHKKKEQDFEAHYDFYDEELKQYKNHIYVQYLVVNNLRWRIEENCLYPSNIDKRNEYIKKITKRLQNIDLSLFKNDLNESILLTLVALQNQNYEMKENGLWISSNKIGDFNNYHKIMKIAVYNNKIKISGRIETPYFQNNLDFFINDKKIPLTYDLEYQKNIIRYYEYEVNICKTINFRLADSKRNYELITQKSDWVSDSKVLGNYNIKVSNQISISKKNVFSRLINKYRNIRSLKFLSINILSSFQFQNKKKTLYYTNKDSKVYDLYEKDSGKKIWLDKNTSIYYKLLILSCNKLVTDQSIQEVLPFGQLRKNYIQSSRFEIELYSKEG